MYRILLTFLCFVVLVEAPKVYGQCTPPQAETCEEAAVLCSLDEVNGYTCNNPSTQPSPCSPLCSQGGVGHNTSWWAFVCQGGNVCITLTAGGCSSNQGLQYGIWGDCVCGEEIICRSIPCIPPNSVSVACGDVKPCKTYYLWVDGCSGDICDFTLNTQGGGPPSLVPLGFINNIASKIIQPVCVGACNVLFYVNPQPGGCEPTYVWTLDGDEVGGNSNEIHLDFPNDGDFVLCVTAYIGNPSSGSICSQEGPQCATIKVRPIADKIGVPRTLCHEQAQPLGYKWHSQRITMSGTYRESFTDPNCCKFDSIVDFIVLDPPTPANVYYITCDNEPYIDILGHATTPCKDHFIVNLPKTTDPFLCDSSIKLTAVNVDFTPKWRVQCIAGQVELSPNIAIIKPCSVGETYEFDYRWYKNSDPAKKTISKDDHIDVDPVNEDYCVEVNVKVELETEFSLCAKTFCETINEGDLAPKCFPMKGDLPLCIGHDGNYWIDTFIQSKSFFTWTIDGGFVTSKPDSQAVAVKWLLKPGDTGTVCVFYDTDCGRSCEKCLKVPILATPAPNAGPNDSICALANKLQGTKDIGGFWTQISGPGNTVFSDKTDPKADVNVDKYGVYRYVYSESRLGCTGTDTVDFYYNSNPDSSALTYVCNVKQTQYKLHFLVSGGTPPYTVVQGNGTIDVNNYYNSNFYDNLTTYTVLVRDAMGCILTFSFNHECKCTNAVSLFDRGPENKCEDQSFTFNPPQVFILDPNDTMIYVVTTDPDPSVAAGGPPNFIKILSSNTIFYDAGYMNYNTTYYVVVLVGKKDGKGGIDFQAGCVQFDGPKPFIFYQNPTPNAGADDAVCSTTYDLKGISSINGSNLKWRVVSGGPANITDDAAAATQVNTNGSYGTYVFELTEDNHSCVAADRVTITFNPSPFIAVDDKICLDYNDPKFPYEAVIKITNGVAPYTIIQGGGKIVGNIYTTDSLASLVNFNVEIQDANGCVSNLIIDTYNCNCGNINAGKLDSNLTELCVDKCVTIKSLIPEITDPEDAVMYVLHQSSYNDKIIPRIDTFYSINDIICFNPAKGMVTGKTYYITRVVGNDTMPKNKIVDASDPCLRASNNQPIIWYPYPTPDAGPNDSVCFYNYQLNGITNSGTPSWKWISGPPPGSTILSPNSDVTNVTVSGKGTYRYELTENFKGCISTTTVDITYWDSPDWIPVPPPYECDNTAEHYRVTIDGENGDHPSWVVDGYDFPNGVLQGQFVGANTWRTDWLSNNDTFRLIINDRHDCLPDTVSNTYVCPCINALGNLDHTPIILCIDGTAQTKYNGGTPDGNDVIRYILYDGLPADPKGGNHIVFNSTGTFVFDPSKMQAGKTYYIAVFMGNADPSDPNNKILLSDRCLKFDVVPVTWYNYPVAKITGIDTLTCTRTTVVLDGSLSTSGSPTPVTFTWTASNGGKINGPANNNTIIAGAAGTYELDVVDPISKCTNKTTYQVYLDVVKPTVAIGVPAKITCAQTSVVLDGSASSQGNEYNIRWNGPGNITNGGSYKPTVDATGQYHLIVTNQNNGCVDSTAVNVLSDVIKPIPDIKALGQLTCTVKQIDLDASGSIGRSGPINSYTWSTGKGNIVAGKGTSKITIDKAGTYQVLVKDQTNGCDSLTNLDVVEIGNPFVGFDLLGANPRCFGEHNGNVIINGVIADGPATGLEYNFNNQGFGPATTFPNLAQGTYPLRVKDKNGCTHDTTITLVEPSKLGIQVIKSIVVDQDSLIHLRDLILKISGGTPSYKDTAWLNTNQNIDWKSQLDYHADTTRDFLITVTDSAGCQIQERIKVIVRIIKDVWWPTAFTPNGDGDNDVWNLKGKRVRNIRTLNIYDRWGELVYAIQNIKDGNLDPSVGWKGMFKGEKALPGVYVFYAEIEYVGSEGYDKYKGDFTLIR